MVSPSVIRNLTEILDWTDITPDAVPAIIPNTGTCNTIQVNNGFRRLFIAESGNSGTTTFFGRAYTFGAPIDLTNLLLIFGWGIFSGNVGNYNSINSNSGIGFGIIDTSNQYAFWTLGGANTVGGQTQTTFNGIIDPSNRSTARVSSPDLDLQNIVTFQFGATKGASTATSRPFGTTIRSVGKNILINGEVGNTGNFTDLAGLSRISVNGSQIFSPYPVQLGDGVTPTLIDINGQSLAFEEDEPPTNPNTHIPDGRLGLDINVGPLDNITVNASLVSSGKPYNVEVLPTSNPAGLATISATFFGIQQFILRSPVRFESTLDSPLLSLIVLGGVVEDAIVRSSQANYAVDYQTGTINSLTIRNSTSTGLLLHYLGDLSSIAVNLNDNLTADIALDLQWLNNTFYPANAIIYDANATSPGWYVSTSAGISSGTGVNDDTGVNWVPRTTQELNLNLPNITFGSSSISPVNITRLSDNSNDSIIVTVSDTTGLTTTTLSGPIVLEETKPVISIIGFPTGSTVIVSQAGIQLDLLNNATSPYTFQTGSQGDTANIYTFKVISDGNLDFITNLDITQNLIAQYITTEENSNQIIDKSLLDFKELMHLDEAFRRIANTDSTLNTQLWELSPWQTEWNTIVVADNPSALEITNWTNYLITTGYTKISFNASTGEVA